MPYDHDSVHGVECQHEHVDDAEHHQRSGADRRTCIGKGISKTFHDLRGECGLSDWLKGIVYLQWNGSSLTENGDLVTKPCNM